MVSRARLARELHPLAWWAWAIALAAAASLVLNPWVHALLIASIVVVVLARRGDHLWARSFRLYLIAAAIVVVLRVAFRILLGGAYGSVVVLELPAVPLPDFMLGLQLLGPVTREALLGGLYDGLRLATILVCVGAANALANPKRLLACVPAALYEVGTALVVAVTVVSQFSDSITRVRRAQQLRPGPRGRWARARRLLLPVLEDALDRSLALAASMDVRGYGRTGGATPAERRRTGALLIAGLIGICVGTYAVLDRTAPRVLGAPMLVAGVLLALAGLRSAGRRVTRTRLRAEPWRWPESAVVAAGLAAAVLAWVLTRVQPAVAFPDPLAAPTVTLTALAVSLVGLIAVVAPAAPRATASTAPRASASTAEALR